MKRWRKIVLVAAAVVVAALVAHGLMPSPVEVELTKVKRGPLSVSVLEEGKTRVINRFIISAPVNGFMRRIALKAGAVLSKGAPVAELEPLRSDALDERSRAGAEARVNAARAALSAAQENAGAVRALAERAIAEYERIKELHAEGYISKKELDAAEAEARSLRAGLRSAEFRVQVSSFELKEARAALDHSFGDAVTVGGGSQKPVTVRSPVDGFVLKIYGESERVVKAGEALMEVGDPSALEVVTDVLSDDAVRIGPGTRVLYDRWGGDATLEGRVLTVEPFGFTKISALGIEEQRVFVVAGITTPYEERKRLGDGYRVESRFILWEGESVLQAPSSALFRKGDGWAVFTVSNGRAVMTAVKLGHRSGLSAEILSGLKEGQEVVTHPDDAVSDGGKVKVKN